MSDQQRNVNVQHPRELLRTERSAVARFNDSLALKITNSVGSMWSAYLFALLSLLSLPAILVSINPDLKHYFPAWIIAPSMITLVAWISQNFLQLQDDRKDAEDKIQAARRFYNANVRDFNTKIEVFPNNLIASRLNFSKYDFFEIGNPEQRKAVQVKF